LHGPGMKERVACCTGLFKQLSGVYKVTWSALVIFICGIFGRGHTADRHIHKIKTLIKKKHMLTTRLIILFNIMSLYCWV